MTLGEVITIAIVGGIALWITLTGVYITAHGGSWEDYWKKRLKEAKAKSERARQREQANLNKSLDAATKAWFEELDIKQNEKADRNKRRSNIYGGIIGFGGVFSIFYIIARAIVGTEVHTDSGMYNTAMKEIPVIVCFGFLGFLVVYTLAYYFIKFLLFRGASKINPRNEVRTEGIIYSLSGGGSSVSDRGTKDSYYVLVAVRGLPDLVRGRILVKQCFKSGTTTGREPRRGDKVTVAYDQFKPKKCKVLACEFST